MAKVNAEKYRNTRPKVEVTDLEGGDFIVLVCSAFGEQSFNDGGRSKLTPFLEFEETGEKVLWLNPAQIGYLIERLGDDSDDWVGQPIPLEKHAYTFGGREGVNLWVAAPERWDEMLAEAGFKTTRKVGKAASSSKKRGK